MYQPPPPEKPRGNPHATRDLIIWLAFIVAIVLLLMQNYWG